jgi:type I restriction enzyme S subunit
MPNSTTELLEKHFDLALEAPDGITKLRELILTLAMQGKLVPQDSNDPPASELLKEIAAEKRRVVREGQTRAASKTPEESKHKAPVELPASWAWATLSDLGYFLGGKTPSTNNPSFWHGQIPWVSAKDMKTRLIEDSEDHVTVEGQQSGLPLIPEGSILMVVRSGILRRTFPLAINQVQCTINQDLKALVPYVPGLSTFILAMLQAFEGFILQELSKKGVTVESITFDEFAATGFPIPPLPEQRWIVARIDQLMAACDELERKRDALVQKRLAVHNSAIRRLLEAAKGEDFSSAWDFLVGHFDEVYAVKENVAELRKAILQLAVLGQLTSSKDVSRRTSGGPRVSVVLNVDGNLGLLSTIEGWRIEELGTAAEEIVDCPHSTPKWTTGGKICVRTSQFKPGFLDLTNTQFVSEETYNERIARLRPRGNDILYSREGGILGVACRVPEAVDLCLGQRMMLIRAGSRLEPEFLEMVLNSPIIKRIAEEKTTGGAAPRINISTVKAYPIPIPPLLEQREIIGMVHHLNRLCDSLERQIDSVANQQTHILNAVLGHA